jgi:ubiquinone biosynthesis O-methyltransferase
MVALNICSEWWNSSSSHGTGPLHAMNPVRVSFVRQQLAERHDRLHLKPLQQIKGLSILDVGCGGGLLSEALARLGANMTSIDPSEENIAVARAHSSMSESTKGINYRVDRIENIAQTTEKFDAVCALEVSQHSSIVAAKILRI